MDEVLINTQLAFFFDELVFNPDKLWHSLPESITSELNKNYTVIPIPSDEQLNSVPIVRVESGDGKSCTIARSRLDYFIQGKGREKFLSEKQELLISTGRLLDEYIKKFGRKIKRIGFITRLFIDNAEQERVVEKILTSEFKEKIQGDKFVEGYIRYVKKIPKLGDIPFEVNNFITIEKFAARIVGEADNIKGYLITRDFNSSADFSISDIQIPYDAYIKQSISCFNLPAIRSLL